MIRLENGYIIDSDNGTYSLEAEYEIEKGKFKGGKARRIIGYYGNLLSALRRARDEYIANKIEEHDMTLEEAIAMVWKENKQFNDMLEEIYETD